MRIRRSLTVYSATQLVCIHGHIMLSVARRRACAYMNYHAAQRSGAERRLCSQPTCQSERSGQSLCDVKGSYQTRWLAICEQAKLTAKHTKRCPDGFVCDFVSIQDRFSAVVYNPRSSRRCQRRDGHRRAVDTPSDCWRGRRRRRVRRSGSSSWQYRAHTHQAS